MNGMLNRLLTLVAIGFFFTGCAGSPRIGVTEKRLAPCPSSPNCVTSQTDMTAGQYVEPISYAGSRQQAGSALLSVLDSMDRARVVAAEENYIHAEFRSRVFRFTDDLEFYFPEAPSIIEIRSASRSGYYDFGVNKNRVETIRKLFREKMQTILHREMLPPETD